MRRFDGWVWFGEVRSDVCDVLVSDWISQGLDNRNGEKEGTADDENVNRRAGDFRLPAAFHYRCLKYTSYYDITHVDALKRPFS
jgi:hypothetical protein